VIVGATVSEEAQFRSELVRAGQIAGWMIGRPRFDPAM
jgi:hypothetical protein